MNEQSVSMIMIVGIDIVIEKIDNDDLIHENVCVMTL